MRIRSIHPEQWTDPEFVSCSFEARLLAIALRNLADDNGVFEWSPARIKLQAFPADGIDMPTLLGELADSKQIWRFMVDGKFYGMIRSFQRFQSARHPSFRYPIPTVGLPSGYKLNETYTNQHKQTPILTTKRGKPTVVLPEPSRSPTAGVGEGVGEGIGIGTGTGEEEKIPRKRGPVVAVGVAKDILEAWNETAPALGLPTVRSLTTARVRAAQTRMKDADWERDWRAALARLEACPFCRGENGRGWRADLDWFLRPDTVTRILEGKYDAKTSATPPGICAGPDDYDPFPDGAEKMRKEAAK